MAAYYNEIDPFAAAWLRELIKAGHIADGEVDERSIELVRPDDLRGFVQCHFFAGIGGWSLALRLAGWDDSQPVWTGSCPCQPFSSAGAKAGGHDPRDLWPVWFQLVKECRPVVVFGEQVEAAIGHGWLDRLCDDLEAEDYAVGACGLPGPCVGAFDIRQRLWFVAESSSAERGSRRSERGGADRGGPHVEPSGSGDDGRMADTEHAERWPIRGPVEDERNGRDAGRQETHGQPGARRQVRDMADSDGRKSVNGSLQRGREHGLRAEDRRADGQSREPEWAEGVADTEGRGQRIDRRASRDAGHVDERDTAGDMGNADGSGREARNSQSVGIKARPAQPSDTGFWRDVEWINCTDGKARPTQPGLQPLAHGLSNRVGRLRGYGNAIKPPLAQVFIEAYMSVAAMEVTRA